MRKIIHIDMDCFYAAIEQRDRPEWRGLPLVVGGSPDSRGVVMTASYEARKFGVKSAMPCKTAYRLCPQAIFTPPRFDAYKTASAHIREIFRRYTDLVEPLSLDEAYLDVTENKKGILSARQMAMEIKQSIKDELQLTASAGVSINKFVAKVASDMQKPDGLTLIGPDKLQAFIEQLPVEKFFGVGKVTAQKMHELGIFTGADIKNRTAEELQKHFGKTGAFYHSIAQGIDNRPVQPNRETKSVSVENTFSDDVNDARILLAELEMLCNQLLQRMRKHQLQGRTVSVKIKYADFKIITRSKTLDHFASTEEELFDTVQEIFNAVFQESRKIRLVGVALSTFSFPEEVKKNGNGQLRLFS